MTGYYATPALLMVWGAGIVAPATPPPSIVSALYRDRQILRLIADALTDTGAFDAVVTDGQPDLAGSDKRNVAALTWLGFEADFDELGDDFDTAPELDTVLFRLCLIVRDQDGDTAIDELSRLVSVARNAINGQSFGGVTAPPMTCLNRGEVSTVTGVERRIDIEGQATYIVDVWDGGHNEDDDSS